MYFKQNAISTHSLQSYLILHIIAIYNRNVITLQAIPYKAKEWHSLRNECDVLLVRMNVQTRRENSSLFKVMFLSMCM